MLKEHASKHLRINIGDRNGDTPLHVACRSGSSSGTNTNNTNNTTNTTNNTNKQHNLDIAILLIEHGGNVYISNENNETPLTYIHNFDDKLMLEKASVS